MAWRLEPQRALGERERIGFRDRRGVAGLVDSRGGGNFDHGPLKPRPSPSSTDAPLSLVIRRATLCVDCGQVSDTLISHARRPSWIGYACSSRLMAGVRLWVSILTRQMGWSTS
jgi:hypothetical protein